MKKLLFLGVIFAMILFAGCGSSKNEDKTDSGEAESDTDTADTEQADDSDSQPVDTDTTPEQPDDADSNTTNPSDDSDSDSQPDDDDPEDPPYSSGRGCNAKTSYGSTSFTRDESSVFDSCVIGAKYSDSSCNYPDAAEFFLKLQQTTIIFKKDCKKNDEPIPCPDFIPELITLSQLTGCNIYRNESTPNDAQPCLPDCPDFYFSTDNEIFKTVELQHAGYDSVSTSDLTYAHIESRNEEKGLSFSIDTGEDYKAVFKSSDSSITLSFELWVDGILEEMPHCEDSEGRKYKAGEKISKECYMMECHYSQWHKSGGGGGYQCESCAVGIKWQWLCADGVTRVDWCECVKDSESQFGSRFSCIERADLNCPEE